MQVEVWVLAAIVALAGVGLVTLIRCAVRFFQRRAATRTAIAMMRKIAGGTDEQLHADLKEMIRQQREALGVWA